jgi:hypothetical protein
LETAQGRTDRFEPKRNALVLHNDDLAGAPGKDAGKDPGHCPHRIRYRPHQRRDQQPGRLHGRQTNRWSTGQIVIRVSIDPHVLCAMTMPGPNGKAVTGEKPDVVSKACLFSGYAPK